MHKKTATSRHFN